METVRSDLSSELSNRMLIEQTEAKGSTGYHYSRIGKLIAASTNVNWSERTDRRTATAWRLGRQSMKSVVMGSICSSLDNQAKVLP